MRGLGGVVLAFLIAGCSRAPDFLYRLHDEPVVNVEKVHKLKELQGENKVDILWVIDNSGSMGNHQQQLIKNADTFINAFVANGGLEWKMGIVSTDIRQDPYIGFTNSTLLTYQSPDNVQEFKRAVARLGTMGDAYEKTFAPIKQHLTDYPDFPRKNAVLAIIMVTDAPEQSNIEAQDVIQFLTAVKGDIRRVVSYGVFADDTECDYTDEPWEYPGSPYEELIKATSGIRYILCSDFGQNLADMGKDLVQRVRRPYILLAERPIESTLRVVYKGKDLPGGPFESGGKWLYDFRQNRVVFHDLNFAPTDQEEVTILYDVPKP
ncbi:VWA domain-containing protein [bacterium]|nr:VWA domain-containing protein [bacterium]